MHLSVVLVEPIYSENIGLIARAMKNFNVNDLRLVKPKANHLSIKAKSRAMHASEILFKAKTFESLNSALKDFDLTIATTAKTTKSEKHYRKALTLKQLIKIYANSNKKIALVFGRETIGLTNNELIECDLIVRIPSSKEYKTLNLSHAVAIMLYEFFCAKKTHEIKLAEKNTRKQAIKCFDLLTERITGIKNKKATAYAFKQLISRAIITEKELKAILAVLKRLI